MSDQFVTLFGQFTDANGNYGSGNYEIMAAGTLMESAAIGLVTPIILGQLDSLGSLSKLGIMSPVNLQAPAGTVSPNTGIPILASDNFGSNNLLWNFKIIVQGMQNIIAENVVINFASGASQNLFTVLQASGWTAPQSPQFGP